MQAFSYQPYQVFNWLNILFPEFPRLQIRAAGEITSRIQLTLTYLGLMWANRERGDQKFLSATCLPGAFSLIALLLMKCWCNYKKEALFVFLLMRVMLVSAQTGVMKSQSARSAPAHLLSVSTVSCMSPSITFQHVTLTGSSSQGPWISSFMFVQARWRFGDYLFTSAMEERPRCSRGFYHPTHFLD